MRFNIKLGTLKTLTLATAISLIIPLGFDDVANAQIQRGNPGSSQPQNFFEALFPNLIEQRLRRERERTPVETVKISAPKVFDYSAEKLTRVDLTPLTLVATKAVQEAPEAEQASFESNAQTVSDTDPQPTGSIVEEIVVDTDFDRVSRAFGELSLMEEPEIAEAVLEHYSANRELLWLDEELQPNAHARSVVAVLQNADEVGLEPSDYDVGFPATDKAIDLIEAARLETTLTLRAVRYGMDASAGRVNPNKLSGYHDFPENRVTAKEVISELTSSGLPARKLAGFNPESAHFEALKSELANIEKASGDLIVIPRKTLIRPGDTHEEVPNVIAAIAKRGSSEIAETAKTLLNQAELVTSFTPEVVDLVKAFQKEQKLGADGVVGPNTITKLTDVDPETKRERVIFAMERLRWHPKDLGARHVFINQPSYT
ncbi:MAG: peptidoglycan-binding protein, partial [Rhizobiaceae bacterium]